MRFPQCAGLFRSGLTTVKIKGDSDEGRFHDEGDKGSSNEGHLLVKDST
jgi:hypothetical protein